MKDEFLWYKMGAWIVGVGSFFAIWIYAFVSWGFLIGLAIGWLPALIGGAILGFLWPLALLIVAGGLLFLYWFAS